MLLYTYKVNKAMTDQEAGRRFHHKLIDTQDKPCLWCGSYQDRKIDRIIEGGRYKMSNIRVLCLECYIKRHNKMNKFEVHISFIVVAKTRPEAYGVAGQLIHKYMRDMANVDSVSRKPISHPEHWIAINEPIEARQ